MDLSISKGQVNDVTVLVNNTEVTVQQANNITVEVTPSATQYVAIDRGIQGATGTAATIAVGTTTTLSAGSSATVNNSGTSNDAVFNFGIPQGIKGDTGAGVATGGTTGQVLAKASNTNYDTTWASTTGTGNVVLDTRPTLTVTGSGLTLQDATDNTKQANFSLANLNAGTTTNYILPLTTTGATLATTNANTFTGNQTFTGVTNTFGNTGSNSTTNIATGATAATLTKAINIGTNGGAISTTNIVIGSATSLATTNGTIYGNWTFNTPLAATNMTKATTSTNGYLSSTDWNTFNNKGSGTVTSVAATSGTGISVTGSPITSSGTLNITNTAPDQVVSLLGTGTTTVTGTYPNFTINSSGGGSGTVTSVGLSAPTGLSVSGSPVTTSGTLALSYASGYSIPTDAEQAIWDTAIQSITSTDGSVVVTPTGTTTDLSVPVAASTTLV
jgi:hypothetical protein